jgi:hypothetical protein
VYGCTAGAASHEALVIDERANPRTGRCEFLVRKSWGTDCAQYHRAGWDCEHGQIWVDSEDLGSNILSIGSFDRD